MRAILKISRSLMLSSGNVRHVFWLSRDQGIGALLNYLLPYCGGGVRTICFNIRNAPLDPRLSPLSYFYERLAFMFPPKLYYSNSQQSLDSFFEKYNLFDVETTVFKNILPYRDIRWSFSSKEKISLIFVGHRNKIKGFDLFIGLLSRLGPEIIDSVYIYGFEDKKLSRVERSYLRRFRSYICRIDYDWLNRAYVNAIFINTSRTEGSPSAPMEAASCGIPVVLPAHAKVDGQESLPISYYKDISEINKEFLDDVLICNRR